MIRAKECEECQGEGLILIEETWQECPICWGKGRIIYGKDSNNNGVK